MTRKDAGRATARLGAGLAACLAAADVFRHVFLPGGEQRDGECEIVVPNVGEWATDDGDVHGNVGSLVLAGGGAIGNAAAWALSRTRVEGSIEIVDPRVGGPRQSATVRTGGT